MRMSPVIARRQLARALLAVVVLALALAGCSSGSSAPSPSTPSSSSAGASGFDGAALPPGAPAHEFTLTDQGGPGVSLSQYRGQVTILAFLYSTCGAICTVIAQQIRGALDELARPVPVLIISADPEADTPARIKRFLAGVSLTGRVHYLTGSRAALAPVWRSFRIVPASAGRAAFDRSASVLVLDRVGSERVIFQLEQLTPEALAHDVRKLL
jgi:cytochrome oxidase Cu insertion factor (SCO1/SenC/PrrC family)